MSENAGTKQKKQNVLPKEQLEAAKKWLQLVAQAKADETLKQRLMDAPVAVLQEHGIKVRPGLDIRVVENTDKLAYLMLPATGSSELTNEQLDAVAGGAASVSLWDILGPSICYVMAVNEPMWEPECR